ncbi:hypothetical protein LWI29_033922 [Acer saccharum]|uniref:Uncharacterized protein n=1 Tax=Acer saccharum TaxID=4024 RepID=A0AA39SHT5_ACESA|nr:hypothetical protein LWI29_033922 [Acer saccharum]
MEETTSDVRKRKRWRWKRLLVTNRVMTPTRLSRGFSGPPPPTPTATRDLLKAASIPSSLPFILIDRGRTTVKLQELDDHCGDDDGDGDGGGGGSGGGSGGRVKVEEQEKVTLRGHCHRHHGGSVARWMKDGLA